MTDRHAAYIVAQDDDIREDSAEPILNALRMVKGVISVEPVVAGYNLRIAHTRVDDEWRDRLRQFAREGNGVTRT